jgi:hypothetical protein
MLPLSAQSIDAQGGATKSEGKSFFPDSAEQHQGSNGG